MLQKNIKNNHKKAFTLIELLISISIFVILSLLIIPGMNDFMQRNRSFCKVQQIVAALMLTRTEAIIRGQNVMFCGSDDGISCGGDWNEGQLILDSKKNVIRPFAAIHKGDKLFWKSSLSDDKDNYVEFLPTGETNGQQGSFYYCPDSNVKNSFAIVIQQSGFLRISQTVVDCNESLQKNVML